jgi:hypothetical protein
MEGFNGLRKLFSSFPTFSPVFRLGELTFQTEISQKENPWGLHHRVPPVKIRIKRVLLVERRAPTSKNLSPRVNSINTREVSENLVHFWGPLPRLKRVVCARFFRILSLMVHTGAHAEGILIKFAYMQVLTLPRLIARSKELWRAIIDNYKTRLPTNCYRYLTKPHQL